MFWSPTARPDAGRRARTKCGMVSATRRFVTTSLGIAQEDDGVHGPGRSGEARAAAAREHGPGAATADGVFVSALVAWHAGRGVGCGLPRSSTMSLQAILARNPQRELYRDFGRFLDAGADRRQRRRRADISYSRTARHFSVDSATWPLRPPLPKASSSTIARRRARSLRGLAIAVGDPARRARLNARSCSAKRPTATPQRNSSANIAQPAAVQQAFDAGRSVLARDALGDPDRNARSARSI